MADGFENKLRAAYQAWSDSKGGSIETWLVLMDEGAKFGSLAAGAPQAEFTAPTSGKAGVRAYLDGLTSGWQMIWAHMDEFIVSGDRIVVLGEVCWRNKTTGRDLTTPKADVWRHNGGVATEYFEFYDTARLQAAASA